MTHKVQKYTFRKVPHCNTLMIKFLHQKWMNTLTGSKEVQYGQFLFTIFYAIRPRKSGQFDYVHCFYMYHTPCTSRTKSCFSFTVFKLSSTSILNIIYMCAHKVSHFNLINWARALKAQKDLLCHIFVFIFTHHSHANGSQSCYLIRSLVTNDI